MSDLERYGLSWNGPKDFIPVEMPDGYWTPWHIAAERIESLQAEVADLLSANNDTGLLLDKAQERIAELEDKVSVQSYFLKQYHEAEDIADKRIAELEAHIKTLFYFDENHIPIRAEPPKGDDH